MRSIEEEDDMLADRLNTEPVIFRGYSDSELGLAIKVAGFLCFPAGLVVGYLFGNIAIGLGGAMIAVIGSVALGATLFQRLKRGRPDFYFQQKLRIVLGSIGLSSCGLFRHRGQMSLGRETSAR
jgi:conjugative transfer region protein (TIGR03750 family)